MSKKESITKSELKDFIKNEPEKIKVVDVRSKEEYDAQLIPDAINIPLDQLNDYLKNEKEDVQIITVCHRGGNRSKEGALLCSTNGIKEAQYLEGGTLGWFEENV